jgi:Tol biopolymer transport system component
VLASEAGFETVNNLHSNIARASHTLFFSVLIIASEARAQEYTETLLSTDNAYNPIPSPDGRYIAYVRTGWGEKSWIGFGRASLVSDVKIVNMEGAPASKTLAQDYFLSGWTPDSTHLLCFRDGKYILLSIDGKVGRKGNIPNDQKLNSFSEWVAYLPTIGSIVWNRQVDKSYRVIETKGQTIVKEKGFWGERVVPSPDGRYLAVFKEFSKTNLRVYDIRSQTWTDLGEVTIHPDKDWLYIQPNWSPWFADGSRLVFLRDSTLVISSPDGIQQTEGKINEVAGLPVPSPDGESVAYVTYEPRPMRARPDLQFWGGTIIWVVPASAGATPRAVTQKSQDEVYDLKWINNDTVVFDRVADEVFYKQARVWKAAVPR